MATDQYPSKARLLLPSIIIPKYNVQDCAARSRTFQNYYDKVQEQLKLLSGMDELLVGLLSRNRKYTFIATTCLLYVQECLAKVAVKYSA